MTDYITKASGSSAEYSSGMVRENPVTAVWPDDLRMEDVHELGWRVAFWLAEEEA